MACFLRMDVRRPLVAIAGELGFALEISVYGADDPGRPR